MAGVRNWGQGRQYLVYQRKARDVKFKLFCALSWRLVSEEDEIQLFSCGWTSFSLIVELPALGCTFLLLYHCCVMFVWLCHEPEKQIKMKIVFFLLLLIFHQPEQWHWRLHVAAWTVTAAVLWAVPVTDHVWVFCKELLILTSSKRFCEGTPVSAAVMCL